jgi:multidrug efflux pump
VLSRDAEAGAGWIMHAGFRGGGGELLCRCWVKALKSELAPVEDRGVILGVFLGPEGATSTT